MKLSKKRIAYILDGFNDRAEIIVKRIEEKKNKEYLKDKKLLRKCVEK